MSAHSQRHKFMFLTTRVENMRRLVRKGNRDLDGCTHNELPWEVVTE